MSTEMKQAKAEAGTVPAETEVAVIGAGPGGMSRPSAWRNLASKSS